MSVEPVVLRRSEYPVNDVLSYAGFVCRWHELAAVRGIMARAEREHPGDARWLRDLRALWHASHSLTADYGPPSLTRWQRDIDEEHMREPV